MTNGIWPTIASPADAEEWAGRIARAPAIERLTLGHGTERGWVDPARLTVVDVYLEGASGHQLQALATLLDWADEAQALGAVDGPWIGRLQEAEARVLGELGRAWELPAPAVRRRLCSMRRTSTRDAPPGPPSLPEPPQFSLEHSWSAGGPSLGSLDVGATLTILEGGFPGPSGALIEDSTMVIETRPGRWTLRLIRETEASTWSAQTLCEPVDEPVTWLLLSHPSFDRIPTVADDVTAPIGEWAGKLSVVVGEPSELQLLSLRHSPNHYIDRWDWGITLLRARCPVHVALGGPVGAREWIALCDPLSE